MTTFQLFFDGGTNGQNSSRSGGSGYGSWEVRWNGFSKKVSRVQFLPDKTQPTITNNVAEFLSLIGALTFIQSVKDKGRYRVEVFGDSQLVLKTVSGEWKCKQPHLKPLRDLCSTLLNGFAQRGFVWQGRINNVRRFGH